MRAPFDAALLTVKGFALQGAMDDLAPAVRPDTIILPVLNGMRHVQVLKDRFGEAAVGGCVCRCATTLDDNGRIVQLTKLHDLTYGEMDGRSTARIQLLDAFMTGAGFDAHPEFPYQIDFAMYGNDVMDLTSAGLRSM
jgi:2-dehydropantoate 2-reductase